MHGLTIVLWKNLTLSTDGLQHAQGLYCLCIDVVGGMGGSYQLPSTKYMELFEHRESGDVHIDHTKMPNFVCLGDGNA